MKSIHVLRKPCSESTVTANVLRHGTGGINVGGSRIAWASPEDAEETTAAAASFAKSSATTGNVGTAVRVFNSVRQATEPHASGRWPANLVLGACLDGELDEVFPRTKSAAVKNNKVQTERTGRSFKVVQKEAMVVPGPGDSGSAARYFKRVNG